MMSREEISAILSIAGTTFLIGLYLRSVFMGGVRPHPFSWIIWGALDAVVATAQWVGGAGVGAWPTAYCSLMCLTVAMLSLKRGEKRITRSDKAMFVGGLAAIPLWFIANDPLAAVLLSSFINTIGYGPTFRKAFSSPREENLFVFSMGTIEPIFMIASIERYSFTTTLFPATILLCNFLLSAMLIVRRKFLER
jgi:hypothetical protein